MNFRFRKKNKNSTLATMLSGGPDEDSIDKTLGITHGNVHETIMQLERKLNYNRFD